MRLVPPALEIGERAGFEGTDTFGYEGFGMRIALLVENLEGPTVIALDGPWGSGKTVFARQWAGLLRQRGSSVIYFDAFAADAGQDPLFDIASQIFEAAPEGEPRREWADAAAALVKRLGPAAAGFGLRVATSGLVGEKEIRVTAAGLAAAKKAGTDGGEEVSGAFRHRIEGARDRMRALSDFRQKLTALADAMRKKAIEAADDVSDSKKPRPVVMIVDELDRCRPNYALDMLEHIKHVFDVDGFCIVLVVNRKQLDGMAGTLYGTQQGHRYFEKFFHLTLELPTFIRRTNTNTKAQYLTYLSQKMLAQNYPPVNLWIEWMLAIAEYRNWSLRTVEHMVRDVEVCLSPGRLDYQDPRLVTIVCALHTDAQDMYSKMRSGTITRRDLNECLGTQEWDQPSHRERFQEILERHFPAKPSDDNPEGGVYPDRAVTALCDLLDRMGQREPGT